MIEQQAEPQPQEPAPAPPVKPPTLASLLITDMGRIIQALYGIESSLDVLVVRVVKASERAGLLSMVAIGMASLSVLLNIAVLVLVAYLLGRVR